MTTPASPSPEILWRQYALLVDLYKFYLDVVIKMNAFYYGVTGAILAYFFKNGSNPLVRYALVLPILFSIALALLFFYGAILMRVLRLDVFNIRDALGLATAPDLGVLSKMLWGAGGIALIVGISMIVLILMHP